MKTSAATLLGIIATLLSSHAVSAQVPNATPAAPQSGQSGLLLTEPASVKRPGEATLHNRRVQTTTQLNEISKSIQANPNRSNAGGTEFLDKVIPPNLLRTPTVQKTDENPIGFFQISPPTPSVGVNLNEIR